MKIRTADLTGAALDWAVAHAHGWSYASDYSPSTSRNDGSQIIKREGIECVRGNDLYFPAGNEKGDFYEPLWLASLNGGRKFHGRTDLEAGLRCFVASRLGEEVDVPEELMA